MPARLSPSTSAPLQGGQRDTQSASATPEGFLINSFVAPGRPMPVAPTGPNFSATVGDALRGENIFMPRGPAYTRPAPLPRRGVKYTTVQKNLIKMSCVSDFPEGREATPSGSSVSLDRARASNSESAGASAPARSESVSNSAATEASAPASTPATRTRPPIITPKFRGLCGTAVCCIINPVSGHFCKIRILIDSGANLSLIDRALAKAVGLTGSPTVISISTADGGTKVHKEIEVVFYLATQDKSTVTRPIVAMVSDAFLNSSYTSINIDPRDHEYLEGIELAEDFPSPQTRPYHLILGEPYVSFITHDRVRRPQRPDLPFACRLT